MFIIQLYTLKALNTHVNNRFKEYLLHFSSNNISYDYYHKLSKKSLILLDVYRMVIRKVQLYCLMVII